MNGHTEKKKKKADMNSLEFPAEWKRGVTFVETGLGRRLFEPKVKSPLED